MGRTSKNIKLRIPEKSRKIKGFRTGSYRVATTISSALVAADLSDILTANITLYHITFFLSFEGLFIVVSLNLVTILY